MARSPEQLRSLFRATNPGLQGCGLLNVCHAYRNATLSAEHVARAKAALDVHAFIGLTEAYDSSVKLALHTFGLEAMPGDFAHLRVKKGPKCQGADSIKLDAKACRATFAFNQYDHEIYEHAHRLFCSRLQSAGLRGDEAVEAELASSSLCGALDFSKVDDVCGRLETPERLMKKAAHDARCAHRGPGAQPRVADESIGGLFSRLRGA